MHGRRVALGVLGSALATMGGAFLVPFFQKALDGQSVHLWPNPLFLIPAVVLALGVGILIGLVATRETDAEAATADALVRQRVLEWLEVNIELTKQEIQARTKAEPETIERAVASLEAEGRVRVRSTAKGQVISRREIIYHETGGVAGVETVFDDGRREGLPPLRDCPKFGCALMCEDSTSPKGAAPCLRPTPLSSVATSSP
jgi:hypothetical protein